MLYSVPNWLLYSVGNWMPYSVGKWLPYSVGKWMPCSVGKWLRYNTAIRWKDPRRPNLHHCYFYLLYLCSVLKMKHRQGQRLKTGSYTTEALPVSSSSNIVLSLGGELVGSFMLLLPYILQIVWIKKQKMLISWQNSLFNKLFSNNLSINALLSVWTARKIIYINR